MKLCKDCKCYRVGDSCYRDKYISSVNGETRYKRRSCDMEREGSHLWSIVIGRCGKSGRFFKEIVK